MPNWALCSLDSCWLQQTVIHSIISPFFRKSKVHKLFYFALCHLTIKQVLDTASHFINTLKSIEDGITILYTPYLVLSHAVEGMLLDTSITPPKCEACILGKQTHTPVLKTCKGSRAEHPLDHVYIGLCGPMSIPFCTRCLYSMNVIDDYSSFFFFFLDLNLYSAACTTRHRGGHVVVMYYA